MNYAIAFPTAFYGGVLTNRFATTDNVSTKNGDLCIVLRDSDSTLVNDKQQLFVRKTDKNGTATDTGYFCYIAVGY